MTGGAFVAACQSDLQNAVVSTPDQRIAAGTPTGAGLHPRALSVFVCRCRW
jgi:hypothetical protein